MLIIKKKKIKNKNKINNNNLNQRHFFKKIE